ncbi:cell division control protein 48 homolog B isoform X2 [Eurytemora carolleeae]|uniref:cell division control protein 48 homolog B isoform X1 n=1 Tax=Eurytemora carolleeae TaxID=1294199 RepID=UPI000C75C6CA|nr:cell division control protein 48 homolog B isoform X1 [Eurytemora carolleeae]XP_023349426.1 cell division control protein 48 homolog B isoform X2 [Eurytemora carolleeae]|eukprot:XP_023349425.1 cell division control protein 48 homolog B-like isoform X1 [Eurytemora affinis]
MESIEIDFVKPEKSSLQKLYIGEGWMRRTGLKPGNIVLINRSFIARVFLHRIREVSSGICSTGSQIQNLGELLPHLTPQQGLQQSTLEKLNLTTVGSISVVLVLTKKIEDMEGYSEILRDVLHNVCFVNNTTVLLEENTVAKLHHISAVQIHLDKSGFSYKINRLTNIKIARVYTTRYIHRMKKTKSAPLVGGVEGLYSKLYKCLRQKNQHILLSGPSGCGKGSLVNRLAADLEWPVISQDCSELGSGSGALEQIFDEAEEISAQDPDNPGTILVLRNIETAGGKKGIHLLQGISKLSSYLDKYKPSDNIVVVVTTTKPQEVSPGLRRPGRLGVEFFMKVPTQDERLRILECLEEQLKLNLEAGYLEKIAGCTRGYLASDLALLTRRILWADPGSGWTGIQKCIDITVPSGLRLGLGWVNLETISWDSIGEWKM